MAKEEEAYRISGQQLVEQRSARNVLSMSLSVDVGLSGGVPQGSTVVIGGRYGLGKTTVALQYAAIAQNKYGSKVFFFPIEGRLTQTIFKQIQGIKLDEDHFEVVMPPPIEVKGKIVGNKKWHAQRWWTEIGETIVDNPGCVVIVDAIANLSSEKEQSEGMGYQGRGDLQKAESQFCRIYGDQVIPKGVTLFLLTHIQANTSGYGETMQLKMGNDIRHQADIILFGRSVEKWDEEDGRIRGHNMIYRVDKSALGQNNLEFKLPLRYGVGIDSRKDLINHAVNWGLINKPAKSSWYTLPFIDSGGKLTFVDPELSEGADLVKVQGENGTWKWFGEHPTEEQLIQSMIKERIGL